MASRGQLNVTSKNGRTERASEVSVSIISIYHLSISILKIVLEEKLAVYYSHGKISFFICSKADPPTLRF